MPCPILFAGTLYLSATFPHSFLFRTPQNKFKEVTGKDFGPPKKEKKVKKSPEDNQQQPSAKNAEKKAAKAAAKAAKEAKKNANRLEREKREKEKAARLAGVGATNFGDARWCSRSQLPIRRGQRSPT